MSDPQPTQEERILRMVKRVLTDIAKDTYTRPGYRHPLSDDTVMGIRDCLALISARESELANAAGRPMKMRPRFVDEPQTSVVVPLNITGKKNRGKDTDKN
ncbi:MAG: segregation and condensation protein A [Thiohalobacterales bacterium]